MRMEDDKEAAAAAAASSSPSGRIDILDQFREDHLGLRQAEEDRHAQQHLIILQPPSSSTAAPLPPPTAMQYNLTPAGYGGGGCEGFVFPTSEHHAAAAAAAASASALPWSFQQAHAIGPAGHFPAAAAHTGLHINMGRDHSPFRAGSDLPAPPVVPSTQLPAPLITYGDPLYGRRTSPAPLQFGYYDHGGLPLSSVDTLGLAGLYAGGGPADSLLRGVGMGGPAGIPVAAATASSPFAGLGSEFGKMSAQEIMDAKALAASKSHSEAERRRRERINAHLAKLRSLLPSTTKTDKASLLAEVIQHVKELKRQTSEIAEESAVPSESDELTVDEGSDEDGQFVVRASLCCEDRADLLPDLIKALKSLNLRALKAEITTLGGRVRNVLLIAGDDEDDGGRDLDAGAAGCSSDNYAGAPRPQPSVASIQEVLKAVMERTPATEEPPPPAPAAAAAAAGSSSSAGAIKRQRTTSLSSILEHRSI